MQPRERYALHGPTPLADHDLLALVIGTGVSGHSAPAIAQALLEHCGGLASLSRTSLHTLAAVPGVGPARATRLHASLALARRALNSTQPRPRCVASPDDAWAHLGPLLMDQTVEQLHALFLGSRGRILGHRRLTSGSDRHTIVDPRQVFRPAVELGAVSVIVAHNHPSGDPTPSGPDADVTRRLAEAGRVLGIVVLDHLVVGAHGYVSLAQEGVLPAWTPDSRAWVSDASEAH